MRITGSIMKRFQFIHQLKTLFNDFFSNFGASTSILVMKFAKGIENFQNYFDLSFFNDSKRKNLITKKLQSFARKSDSKNFFSRIFRGLIGSVSHFCATYFGNKPINKALFSVGNTTGNLPAQSSSFGFTRLANAETALAIDYSGHVCGFSTRNKWCIKFAHFLVLVNCALYYIIDNLHPQRLNLMAPSSEVIV